MRVQIQFFPSQIQIEPNPGLIQQSPAKTQQRKSFDFLRRIEPYQGVTPTPRAFFYFCAASRLEGEGGVGAAGSPGFLVVSLVFISSSSGLFERSEGLAPFLSRTLGRHSVRPWRPRSLVARKGSPVRGPKARDPRKKTGRSIRRPARIRPLKKSPIRFRAQWTSGRAPALHA